MLPAVGLDDCAIDVKDYEFDCHCQVCFVWCSFKVLLAGLLVCVWCCGEAVLFGF